jgi:hypothetical protein
LLLLAGQEGIQLLVGTVEGKQVFGPIAVQVDLRKHGTIEAASPGIFYGIRINDYFYVVAVAKRMLLGTGGLQKQAYQAQDSAWQRKFHVSH